MKKMFRLSNNSNNKIILVYKKKILLKKIDEIDNDNDYIKK